MSRYFAYFTTDFSPPDVIETFTQYMESEGFNYITYNYEKVWKKGMGLFTAPQFIKLSQNRTEYILEAWVKFALLPGVYVGEMGIEGAMAAVPKSLLKTRVDTALSALHANVLRFEHIKMS